MTAIYSFVFDDNLPRIPVKFYEYALTRADVFAPDGITIEDAVTYATPCAKDDYVILKDDPNSGGEIVVEKYFPGNDVDNIIGKIVDSPKGDDQVTTTGGTPAHAYRRRGTIKLFATAVDMFTADSTITAGYGGVYKESGDTLSITSSGAVPSANGKMVCLAHATDGVKFPVALGYFGSQPAD